MNFVAQVEDHLRDLGSEARKNHPGVKEASERAIIHLRSLQTQYVAAVRRAGASTNNSKHPPSSGSSLPLHPTTALFQSQDLLHPFLLAANYPDASYDLLVIALESIQHLLRGDAVCPEDGIQISRVLVIQSWGCAVTLGLVSDVSRGDSSAAGGTVGLGMAAGMIHAASSSVSGALGGITGMVLGGHYGSNEGHNQSNRTVKEDQSIALKILRTMTMLADSRSVTLTQDVLGGLISVCLLLGAGQTYSEYGSGTTVGTTIRERFIHSASAASNNAQLAAITKDGSSGLTGGTARGDVKRAAIAAMNKLLSILFERAKDAMIVSPTEMNVSKSSILLVAKRTLTDLWFFASKVPTSRTHSQTDLTGPFAIAAKDRLSPSPTTSLALVDMIMKQICGDLFRLCFDFFGSSDAAEQSIPETDQRTTTEGIEFAAQIITQAFQLGRSLLGSQYCYFVTKLSLESSLQEASKPSSPSNLIDFCSYYYTTSLAKTLLAHYLSSTSKMFYANFDARLNVASSQTELRRALTGEKSEHGRKGVSAVSELALDLISQLVQFCNEATEAYHKSDDFEDGYIFTQAERESFDFGKSTQNNRSFSTRSAAQGGGPVQPLLSISNEKLWRSFLALEALSALVSSHLEQVSWLDFGRGRKNDSDCGKLTVSLIAKAASDFATSSASNRERILYLLIAAHAEDDSENSNAAAAAAEKVSEALVIDSIEIPLCDTGATAWLAFKCILFLVQSFKNLAISVEADGDAKSHQNLSALLDGSFAPTVSMLQHFIRRMPGSPIIVSKTLFSYEELSCASMLVDGQSTNVRRQAILTSLCKLCLPSWGKKRQNCQLRESNIDALLTMLWIIHSNFDKIHDEWCIIVGTLDQLAILQIASPTLHPSYSNKATTIAESFSRLPLFTTCFGRDALHQFVTSLVKLSDVVSFDPLEEQSIDIATENLESEGADSVNPAKESSISGKLMSFAGRAFGGGTVQSTSSNNNASVRRASAASQFSKTYAEDLREAICVQMAEMKLSTSRSIVRKIPLPLLFVAVVAEVNSYRLSVIEETVAKHLCEIVARSSSTELQLFALEVLIHFMPLSLSKSEVSLKYGLGPLMVPAKEPPLEVFPIEAISNASASLKTVKVDSERSDPQLLAILCQTIQSSTQVNTTENCLNALLVVLEEEGHNLSGENLRTVMVTLSILSGCESSGNDEAIDRSTKQWSNVSSLAFQNLKLILDDFLEMSSTMDSPLKSIEERDAMLDCCVAFGRSRHDVNTSLTAIGMLWSLADRDVSPGTLDVVLSKLSWLAMDNRPELRNCSVNTLFSCVVGLGDQFTDEQWENCLANIIFGKIMSGIASAIEDSESKKASTNGVASEERYKVAVHHSRDSARKQWINTQTLVLRGLERVLRLFYSRLLVTLMSGSNELWFPQIWKEILRVSFDCAILTGEGETIDTRLAGIELMALCTQLSCQAGIGAAGTSARVGTNMEVVGGALRSVRPAVEDKASEVEKSSILNHPEVESCQQELFDVSFDKLNDFRIYLEQNGDVDDAGSKSFMAVHSPQTQVLTKLTGEMAKIYECCKSNEMLPGLCKLQLDISIDDNNGYESRFLRLLLEIAENAGSDKNMRYLNQVQRGVLSLLQGMASNSSLRAFKALTTISGEYLFVRAKSLSSKLSTGYDDNDHAEIIELEAAKTVASAFDSDGLSNEAKVVVMCSVISQYLKIYGTPGDLNSNAGGKRATSDARYDLLTRVLESGLEAAAHIDSNTDEKDNLDFVWDRIIATVNSLLLPPTDNRYDGYAHHSKSIMNIVAIVLTHLPPRKMSLAEPVLEHGANRAVEAAFSCNEINQDDESVPYLRASEGAIHVFLACFMGLTQIRPSSPAVSSLTSQILEETIESVDVLSRNAGSQSRTRQSLAIAVCESLKTTTSQDLLVGAFPLLCRLTNVENDGLRRAAGKILGQINLSEAISQERQRAEQAISRERQRAEQADARAREIEEENIAMLEEIEYLQAENEELQRQLT